MESEDLKEGFEAFKHKRDPHWPSMPADTYHNKHAEPVTAGRRNGS
jgi:hypothetical protein